MRRSRVLLLVAAGLVVFLIISALLARVFSVDSAERSAITSLVQNEARGDQSAVEAAITGCGSSRACQTRAVTNVSQLRHPGSVTIIQIQASSGFSLGGTLGTARVAWSVRSGLPIVQCVHVRHAGNVVTGLRVELLAVSRRIPSDGDCPARF